MTTPVSSMALVLVGSLIGSVGAIFLKSGAHEVNKDWKSIAFNWRLAVGIGATFPPASTKIPGADGAIWNAKLPICPLLLIPNTAGPAPAEYGI